jgi:hypothetical protein
MTEYIYDEKNQYHSNFYLTLRLASELGTGTGGANAVT